MFAALTEKLFGRGKASKSTARSRLQFVLVQDRTGLSTEEMSQFKREMVAVIEKYFQIDEQGLDISYKRDNDSTTLLINSPVHVRREDEVRRSAERKQRKGAAQAAAS